MVYGTSCFYVCPNGPKIKLEKRIAWLNSNIDSFSKIASSWVEVVLIDEECRLDSKENNLIQRKVAILAKEIFVIVKHKDVTVDDNLMIIRIWEDIGLKLPYSK